MRISLHELLVICQQKLGEHDFKRYWQDLVILLSFFTKTNFDLDELVQNRNQSVEINLSSFLRSLKKITSGKPIGRIVGYVWWDDTKIKVLHNVFLPRIETLTLVQVAQDLIKQQSLSGASLLDLCCGTGCISLAIKKRFPSIRCTLVDCSRKALRNAHKNAQFHGFKFDYLRSNFLKEVFCQNLCFDIIVCNPPYLIKQKHQQVKFDPQRALYASEQGLYFYRVLLQSLKRFKHWPKIVVLEIDEIVKDRLWDLFINEHLPYQWRLINDQYNLPRVVSLVYEQKISL